MRPEDSGRRFIISYRLADDMLTIYEPPVRNSGIIGGKFLERTRVAKPGSPPDSPEYYGPQDFYIGAVIEIFNHRFVITNADAFVLSYMEEHASQFPRKLQAFFVFLSSNHQIMVAVSSSVGQSQNILTKWTDGLITSVRGWRFNAQKEQLHFTFNMWYQFPCCLKKSH